jgi:hypothetical protein
MVVTQVALSQVCVGALSAILLNITPDAKVARVFDRLLENAALTKDKSGHCQMINGWKLLGDVTAHLASRGATGQSSSLNPKP